MLHENCIKRLLSAFCWFWPFNFSRFWSGLFCCIFRFVSSRFVCVSSVRAHPWAHLTNNYYGMRMQQINFNNWYQQMAEKIESFDIRQGRPFNFHTHEYALRFHQLSTNFGCNHFTTNLYLHFRYTFHAFGMRNVKKNYEFVSLHSPKDATSSLSVDGKYREKNEWQTPTTQQKKKKTKPNINAHIECQRSWARSAQPKVPFQLIVCTVNCIQMTIPLFVHGWVQERVRFFSSSVGCCCWTSKSVKYSAF